MEVEQVEVQSHDAWQQISPRSRLEAPIAPIEIWRAPFFRAQSEQR